MMPASRAFVHSDALWTRSCGAEETRTPDFLLAKEALYQLSYGPEAATPLRGGCAFDREREASDRVVQTRPHPAKPDSSVAPGQRPSPDTGGATSSPARVGASGLEPETSALSGQCSNQLS